MRKFTEKKLVIASHNQGKIREISELLKPFGVEIFSGAEFGFDEPVEDGDSFLANSEIKSQYFAAKTGLPSLADDSGLCVDDLGGEPGIYSARWAGETKSFEVASEKIKSELLKRVGDCENKKAHFVCALSLTWADGHTEKFEGKVFGELVFPARGSKGFGYDPIFIARGYDITFAEMNPAEKHKISHRADAFKQLVDGCFAK